jgi:hypothetical protein
MRLNIAACPLLCWFTLWKVDTDSILLRIAHESLAVRSGVGAYSISARSLSYRVVHIARLSLLPGELVAVKPSVRAAEMLDYA